MYSYPHHIGDFIRDTARLTDAQAMAYLRMMWHYYDTEQPLTSDVKRLAFMLGACPEDAQLILEHFFVKEGDFYRHKRCDAEIEAYRNRQEHGRKAAKTRWENAQSMPGVSSEHARSTKNDANREPITDNHITEEPKGSLSESSIPTCPHQEIVDLFHSRLPELPKVMVWNRTRASYLKARWREKAVEEKWADQKAGIQFFEKYFDWVRQSPFLMGKVQNRDRRPFECELEWLLRPSNFVKVLEGKYHGS